MDVRKIIVKVECFAVFVQPHVVHCNVCKAVDGIHVARNLIRGLAYRNQISIMAGSGEKIFSCPFTHGQENMIVIPLKFLDETGTSSEPETTAQGVETRKRKRGKNFTGIQRDGFKFAAR